MNKSIVVIINGKPRSGKDTVCDIAEEVLRGSMLVRSVSTVDLVKEAAEALGWEGEKTEEWRSMLHELKMLWSKKFDGPFTYVITQVHFMDTDESDHVVFVHSREPAEIARFKKKFGDRCHTLLIRRTNCVEANNFADQNVEKYEYDYIINNPDSPHWRDTLAHEVAEFCSKITRR